MAWVAVRLPALTRSWGGVRTAAASDATAAALFSGVHTTWAAARGLSGAAEAHTGADGPDAAADIMNIEAANNAVLNPRHNPI